eukprot:jgi/Mesen1/4206/ME000219S03336
MASSNPETEIVKPVDQVEDTKASPVLGKVLGDLETAGLAIDKPSAEEPLDPHAAVQEASAPAPEEKDAGQAAELAELPADKLAGQELEKASAATTAKPEKEGQADLGEPALGATVKDDAEGDAAAEDDNKPTTRAAIKRKAGSIDSGSKKPCLHAEA